MKVEAMQKFSRRNLSFELCHKYPKLKSWPFNHRILDGHTSSTCGTPEKAERTWDDNGRDGLTNSKDLRVTNGPEVRKTECCGKNLKKKL